MKEVTGTAARKRRPKPEKARPLGLTLYGQSGVREEWERVV